MAEIKPWFGEPPLSAPPELPGYRQVGHERIDMGKLSVIGTLLIPIWAFVLLALVAVFGGRSSYEAHVTFSTVLPFCIMVIAVILVHEIIHGAAAALLGARPSFGVGPGFAYTTFLDPMSKTSYLIVGLAPILLMSVAFIAAAVAWPDFAGWMIVAGTVNASGAIGDLWMTARILRAPKNAVFYDLADGFAVLAPEP